MSPYREDLIGGLVAGVRDANRKPILSVSKIWNDQLVLVCLGSGDEFSCPCEITLGSFAGSAGKLFSSKGEVWP